MSRSFVDKLGDIWTAAALIKASIDISDKAGLPKQETLEGYRVLIVPDRLVKRLEDALEAISKRESNHGG